MRSRWLVRVLMMWDRRVLERLEIMVGSFFVNSVARGGGWFYLGMFRGLWPK